MGVDMRGVEDVVDGFEDMDADSGEATVRARALPTPKTPSPSVVSHNDLTPFPYHAWCPMCCAGRRPNSRHATSDVDPQHSLLMFHGDDCFIMDDVDNHYLTVRVGRKEPSTAKLASP